MPFRLHHLRIKLATGLLTVAALGVFGSARAQETAQGRPMSLKECIDYAFINQATVKNAVIDEKIAHQKVKEVTGIGLPQVNAYAEVNNYVVIPTQQFPDFISPAIYGVLAKEGLVPASKVPTTLNFIPVKFGVQYNATVGATISQLLFDGAYLVGLKASRTYEQLSKRNTKRTKIDAVEQVTKAYYGVVINEQRRKLFDINLKRLEKVYNDTKAYQEAGFAENIDVSRLEVSLSNLRVESEKVNRALEISRYLLKFQMGMPISENIRLTDTLAYQEMIQPGSITTDYNRRIEYALLQTQKQLQEMDIKRHTRSYLPNVSVFANAATQAQRQQFDIFSSSKQWFPFVLVGGRINVPIFDGLQKAARVKAARLALEQTDNNRHNLENLIDFQIKGAEVTYVNAYKTLEIQSRNLKLAEEVARVSNVKFKEGVGSNLEVTTAEADLRTAQINYFDALYSSIVAKVDLQKAQGTLY